MGYTRALRHACAVAAVAFLTVGCATTIMKGYIGKPLQAAMVDYGPPANAFDMGDGRRAFQWEMTEAHQAPTFVNSRGSAVPIGNSVWWTQNTQIVGGGPATTKCLYTLYGRWNGSAWLVESFEKPNLLCE